MPDNTQINANKTAGDWIATDDIGGAKHQRVKVEYGGDGTATEASRDNKRAHQLPEARRPAKTFTTSTREAAAPDSRSRQWRKSHLPKLHGYLPDKLQQLIRER